MMTTLPARQTPGSLRLLVALMVVWNAVYMALAAFPADARCALGRVLLWIIACVLCIAVIFVGRVWRVRRVVAIPLLLIVLFPAQWFFGSTIPLRVRFEFLRAALTAQVERIHAGEHIVHWSDQRSVHIEGDPLSGSSRVAFVDGGLLDNWGGFVFDPSSVPSAGSARGTLESLVRVVPVPMPVRGWFGGEMVFFRSLGGGWFYCSFT